MNGTDVVKVGHRQVVALIRQGGSRLLMKVVSVSRKSDANLIRKKGTLQLPLLIGSSFLLITEFQHKAALINRGVTVRCVSEEMITPHLLS